MRQPDTYGPIRVSDQDDVSSNPTANRPIGEVIEARLGRRGVLKGLAAGAAVGALGGAFGSMMTSRAALAADNPSTLTFEEIEHGIDETHHLPKGYSAKVLIRWGDKVAADAPDFDAKSLTAAAQEKHFGYNNDFIAYLPLPVGSDTSDHGLLCVNHEYTNAELMFPGLTEKDKFDKLTKDQVEVEMAAHGHAIVEIKRTGGQWAVVEGSPYNRRISFSTTEIAFSGPAAGHERLKTSSDPDGKTVIGMVNNCSGGKTPWGTVLTCEENFNNYFGGDPSKSAQADAYKRYGLSGKAEYAFWKYHDRLNLEKEPNEPNRFGWVVEIDPYDASAGPVKRTALGRFKHEAATTALAKDGRVVVYLGDDQRFDYIYKFVSKSPYNPNDRAANKNLLDEGTLYVAKFLDDGKLQWLPLVQGEGPLTAANGFNSQGDIVIEARRAADLLGATPMDRPEDIETDPVTGRVYAVMTYNEQRTIDKVDAVNPKANNTTGQIVELIPPGEGKDADHGATEYTWDFFIMAGDPTWGGTIYGKGTSKNGWLACPDNIAFDGRGHIWIATDQGAGQGKFKIGDGLYAADCTGDGRAVTRMFFRCPADAEMCGPAFTPDGKTLFLSVQHPGEGSTFDEPTTRWPDFADGTPPRPSVLAVTKDDGGEIGT